MREISRVAIETDRRFVVLGRRVLRVAGIMVARQVEHRPAERLVEHACRRKIALSRSTVQRDVAGALHQVRLAFAQWRMQDGYRNDESGGATSSSDLHSAFTPRQSSTMAATTISAAPRK